MSLTAFIRFMRELPEWVSDYRQWKVLLLFDSSVFVGETRSACRRNAWTRLVATPINAPLMFSQVSADSASGMPGSATHRAVGLVRSAGKHTRILYDRSLSTTGGHCAEICPSRSI